MTCPRCGLVYNWEGPCPKCYRADAETARLRSRVALLEAVAQAARRVSDKPSNRFRAVMGCDDPEQDILDFALAALDATHKEDK